MIGWTAVATTLPTSKATSLRASISATTVSAATACKPAAEPTAAAWKTSAEAATRGEATTKAAAETAIEATTRTAEAAAASVAILADLHDATLPIVAVEGGDCVRSILGVVEGDNTGPLRATIWHHVDVCAQNLAYAD